jgi:hypothetical protein
MKVYMASIRSYLAYYAIDVVPSRFKRRVKMPKVCREDEEPLDASDIRNILLVCNNRRLKAYLLVLASGGMRAVEGLAMRQKDIDSCIEPQISSANITLNQTLASDLNQLSEMVNTSSIDEFDTQSQRIDGILNQTLQQVIPANIADNNTFRLGVVSDLLSLAGVEYGEAVENGTIKEIVEYQDGQAFVSRAQDVFSEASPTLTDLNEVQETNMFFSDLTGAIQNKSSPEVVNRSIGAIIHEISEITGISEENLGSQSTGTGSAEIISEIRSLLNQTVQAYQQQNYPEAEALATTAYIDNFEFMEAPLAEKDEALMEKYRGNVKRTA